MKHLPHNCCIGLRQVLGIANVSSTSANWLHCKLSLQTRRNHRLYSPNFLSNTSVQSAPFTEGLTLEHEPNISSLWLDELAIGLLRYSWARPHAACCSSHVASMGEPGSSSTWYSSIEAYPFTLIFVLESFPLRPISVYATPTRL